jgi:hypothetical protein
VLCTNVLFVIVVPEERVEKHCIKVSNHKKKRGTRMTCVLSGIRPSYDSKFKLMMISYTKTINNCNAAPEVQCYKSKCTKVEKTKTETHKCKLYPKIFQ